MSQTSQYRLLRERRFLPFFCTQFLGAFNDNVYKNALIMFVTFHAAALTTLEFAARSSTYRAVSSSCRSSCFRRRPASSPTNTTNRASSATSSSSRSASW